MPPDVVESILKPTGSEVISMLIRRVSPILGLFPGFGCTQRLGGGRRDGVELRSNGKMIGDIGLLRSDTTSAELVDIRPAEDFVATLVLDGILILS